ncbi:MAG: restriction endonuclease [Candidatus Bathyarchaeia archaeon]
MEINDEIKREIILSILKSAPSGATLKELSGTRFSSYLVEEMLSYLQTEHLISIEGLKVMTNPEQRVRLAVKALELGGDIERVCRLVDWKEFEEFTALAFSLSGYRVKKGFRFSSGGKRWEIDIIALRKPITVCVDCKHWKKRLSKSSIVKVVEDHVWRTNAFIGVIKTFREKLGLEGWAKILTIPIIVSLHSTALKLYEGVPIVPILQLPNFINDLPTQAYSIKHLEVK